MSRNDQVGGISVAIDWDALHRHAVAALAHSYSPYSHFPVGAAALVDDGRIVVGANVENASYGLTLCAECILIGALAMSGGGRLVAFACVDAHSNPLMPCGRCRQLLYEFAAPSLVLMTPEGVLDIDRVLPLAFGPQHLRKNLPDDVDLR